MKRSVTSVKVDWWQQQQQEGDAWSQALSVGMFLVQAINTHLTPGLGLEQAAALLSGGSSQYLKQLLNTGPRGNLRALYDFCHELYISRELLCELLVTKNASLDDVAGFLRMMGVLLYSPDEILVVKAWAVLTELAKRVAQGGELAFAQQEYVATLWQFQRSAWGLGGLVRSWNKAACRPLVLDALLAMTQDEAEQSDRADIKVNGASSGNLSLLFRVDLHEHLSSVTRYMEMCHDLVKAITEGDHGLGHELFRRDLPRYWCGVASRFAEARAAVPCRQAAIGLLAQVWSSFTKDVEQDSALPKAILVVLNKAFRNSTSLSLQIFALATVFDLLESFAAQHKPFAPYLYKTVIFSLIEFHKNAMVRDFIISNLARCLKQMPFAPVGVIITPLVKQLSLHGFTNLDIEFLHALARHQRLDARDIAPLMELCAKIALNDIIFGHAATELFIMLIKRFPYNNVVQQLVMRVFSTAAIMLERSGKQVESAHRTLILKVLTSTVALQVAAINDQVAGMLESRESLKPVAEQLVFLQHQRAINASSFEHAQHQYHMQAHPQFNQGGTGASFLDPVDSEVAEEIAMNDGGAGGEEPAPLFGNDGCEEIGVCGVSKQLQNANQQVLQKNHEQFMTSKVGQQIERIQNIKPQPKLNAKPKFEGLQKLCVEIDPSDTGYVSKVWFLGIVNHKDESNLQTRMLFECTESRIIRDRKLQDKVRRQATSRPGQVSIADLTKIFTEHMRETHKRTKAGCVEKKEKNAVAAAVATTTSGAGSLKKARKAKPPLQSVRDDIEHIAKQRRDKIHAQSRAEGKQRAEDQRRRQRMRKRFASRVDAKREQERLEAPRNSKLKRKASPADLSSQSPQHSGSYHKSITQQVMVQTREMLDFEVAIFKTFDSLLSMIFKSSCRMSCGDNKLFFDNVQNRQTSLSIQAWLRFLRLYKVIPGIASQEEARTCYFRCKGNVAGDITYDEFLLCLASLSTTCLAFSFKPDATSRVFALMGHLRGAALTSLRQRNSIDPTDQKIMVKWAKIKTIPSYRHVAPEQLSAAGLDDGQLPSGKQEAVTIALGVLDDLLSETLGVHLLIPLKDNVIDAEIEVGMQAILKEEKHRLEMRNASNGGAEAKPTRLYPEAQIDAQKKEKAAAGPKRPVIKGFGSNFIKPPTPEKQPRRKKKVDGEAAEPEVPKKPLTVTEKKFLARLEEQNEAKPLKRMEKTATRRKREAAEHAKRDKFAAAERRKRQDELAKQLELHLMHKREQVAERAAADLATKEKALERHVAQEATARHRREAQRVAIEKHKATKRAAAEEEAKAKAAKDAKIREEHRHRFERIKAEHYEIADDADILSKTEKLESEKGGTAAVAAGNAARGRGGKDMALEREKRMVLVKRQRKLEIEKRRIKAGKKEAQAGARLRERHRQFEEKFRKRRNKEKVREAIVAKTLEKEKARLVAKQTKIEQESMAKLDASQQKLTAKKLHDKHKRIESTARKHKVNKMVLDFDAQAKKELQNLAQGVHTPEPDTSLNGGEEVSVTMRSLEGDRSSAEPSSPAAQSEFTELIAKESGTENPAPISPMFAEGHSKNDLGAIGEQGHQQQQPSPESSEDTGVAAISSRDSKATPATGNERIEEESKA